MEISPASLRYKLDDDPILLFCDTYNGKIIHALIKLKSYACKEIQYSFSECKSIWLIHKHFNSFNENDNVRPFT